MIKIDSQLLDLQKNALSIILMLYALFGMLHLDLFKKKGNIEDLKVDINKADIEELEKIPYIGEKTAIKIIERREELGYYKNINELSDIRNFKKFKYFIKVEK